jgi:hypothetical protein
MRVCNVTERSYPPDSQPDERHQENRTKRLKVKMKEVHLLLTAPSSSRSGSQLSDTAPSLVANVKWFAARTRDACRSLIIADALPFLQIF